MASEEQRHTELNQTLKELKATQQALKDALSSRADMMKSFKPAEGPMKDAVSKGMAGTQKAFNSGLEKLIKATHATNKGIDGLYDSINGLMSKVGSKLDNVASDLAKKIQDSKVFQSTKDLALATSGFFKRFAEDWKKGNDRIADLFKRDENGRFRLLGELTENIKRLLQTTKNVIKGDKEKDAKFRESFSNFTKSISQQFGKFFSAERRQQVKERVTNFGNATREGITKVGKFIGENLVKPLKAVTKGLLGNLLKALGAFLIIKDPEAFARMIQSISEGVENLAELFESEKFKEGMKNLGEFVGMVAKFGLDSVERFLDGFTGITNAFAEFQESGFTNIDWAALTIDIGKTIAGFAGIALILAPGATLMVGLKALGGAIKAVLGVIGVGGGVGVGKTLLGALGALTAKATAVALAFDMIAPASAADGTLDAQRDAQGRLPGDPGYDINTRRGGTPRPFFPNIDMSGVFQQGRGFQNGSYISGYGTGDTIPAMLEPGEYVLNRNAVAKIGPTNLDAINFGMAPRFQEGGGVGLFSKLGPFAALGRIVSAVGQEFLGGVSSTLSSIGSSLTGGGTGSGSGTGSGTGGGGTASAPQSPVAPASVPRNSKEVYDYMRSIGLSDIHARGLLANAIRESSLNPTILGDGGHSVGLFQWHRSRATGMKNALGADWKNWRRQIDYALIEPGEPGPQWRNNTYPSAQAAADWWMRRWERPAHPARDSRRHAAILAGLGFQQGGMVPNKTIKAKPSRYSTQFNNTEKISRNSGMYSKQSQPIVIPVPMGNQMSKGVSASTTSTDKVPNLPAAPTTAAAADYFFRSNLGASLHF